MQRVLSLNKALVESLAQPCLSAFHSMGQQAAAGRPGPPFAEEQRRPRPLGQAGTGQQPAEPAAESQRCADAQSRPLYSQRRPMDEGRAQDNSVIKLLSKTRTAWCIFWAAERPTQAPSRQLLTTIL
jgi:hypothetical protein